MADAADAAFPTSAQGLLDEVVASFEILGGPPDLQKHVDAEWQTYIRLAQSANPNNQIGGVPENVHYSDRSRLLFTIVHFTDKILKNINNLNFPGEVLCFKFNQSFDAKYADIPAFGICLKGNEPSDDRGTIIIYPGRMLSVAFVGAPDYNPAGLPLLLAYRNDMDNNRIHEWFSAFIVRKEPPFGHLWPQTPSLLAGMFSKTGRNRPVFEASVDEEIVQRTLRCATMLGKVVEVGFSTTNFGPSYLPAAGGVAIPSIAISGRHPTLDRPGAALVCPTREAPIFMATFPGDKLGVHALEGQWLPLAMPYMPETEAVIRQLAGWCLSPVTELEQPTGGAYHDENKHNSSANPFLGLDFASDECPASLHSTWSQIVSTVKAVAARFPGGLVHHADAKAFGLKWNIEIALHPQPQDGVPLPEGAPSLVFRAGEFSEHEERNIRSASEGTFVLGLSDGRTIYYAPNGQNILAVFNGNSREWPIQDTLNGAPRYTYGSLADEYSKGFQAAAGVTAAQPTDNDREPETG